MFDNDFLFLFWFPIPWQIPGQADCYDEENKNEWVHSSASYQPVSKINVEKRENIGGFVSL